MTEEQKKLAKRAAFLGILLGVLCNLLPEDYRTACRAIASICAGGF